MSENSNLALKDEVPKSDGIIEEIVSVRRTAKVVKGGRIFRFTVVVVVGDGKGNIGIGLGKAREVPQAVQKALENARRNMVRVDLINHTLYHPVSSRHGASKVIMLPAADGTGIIAGGALRAVFKVLGVHNVLSKCVGSTNPINVVKAAVKGLTTMSSPSTVAARRGKKVKEIFTTVKKAKAEEKDK